MTIRFSSLLTILLLTSCGGGGSDDAADGAADDPTSSSTPDPVSTSEPSSTPTPEPTATDSSAPTDTPDPSATPGLELSILSPVEGSNVGGQGQFNVVVALTNHGSNTLPANVGSASVTINGVTATTLDGDYAADNQQLWEAAVPTELNTDITVNYANGDESLTEAVSVNAFTPMRRVGSLAYAAEAGELYAFEPVTAAVVKVLDDGSASSIFLDSTQAGFSSGVNIALDEANNRLLMVRHEPLDGGEFSEQVPALVAFDLDSKAKTILSGAGSKVSTGESIGDFVRDIALLDGDAYLVLGDLPGLLKVDLESGERTIITSDNVGSGEKMLMPNAVTFSSDGNTAYVSTDAAEAAVFKVDMATGNREVITSWTPSDIGEPDWAHPTHIHYVEEGNYVAFLVGETGLVKVDLTTLAREPIASPLGRASSVTFVDDDQFFAFSTLDSEILSGQIGETTKNTLFKTRTDTGELNTAAFGLAFVPGEDALFAMDSSTIRRIDLELSDAEDLESDLSDMMGLVFDPSRNSIVVASIASFDGGGNLFTLDLETGDLTRLDEDEYHEDTRVDNITDIAYGDGMIYMSNSDTWSTKIIGYNLEDDERFVVSDSNSDGDVIFWKPFSLTYDSYTDSIIVAQQNGAGELELIRVHLEQGYRSLLKHTIPDFRVTPGLQIEMVAEDRLIFKDYQALYDITLSTGVTKEILSSSSASGEILSALNNMTFDKATGRLFISDYLRSVIVEVELNSGSRSIIYSGK